MEPSRIQAVDHVNLEAPPGIDEALRWFYGEVAQLEPVDRDGPTHAHLTFRSEGIELRIHMQDTPRIQPIASRVTIAVPSLDAAADLLAERRVEFARLTGLLYNDRRLETSDPAGNRIVLKQHHPFGPL